MCNQCNDSNQEHVHALRTRREVLKAGAALVAAPFLGGVTSIVQAAQAAGTGVPVGRPAHARAGKVRGAATEWLNYAGDKASSKYSLLTQISGGNFNRLRTAWTWRSAEEEVANANHLKTWVWEATPLMVGVVLYISTSLSQVAAIAPPNGKQQWIFHVIPRQGEFGNETWKDGSWKTTGAANVWTMMSADDALGYVYLPFSTPSDDHYGVHRPGDGLFGESLVCLDARTGKRVWHFQMVHHGLWDYDLPCAPNLIDIRVDGKPVKAVAQMSKRGFCYVFDRLTGKPIWPIEEKPVPQSTVPGEKTSPTQPFPTKPAPFDRQGVTENDVIDFTPELRKQALAVLEKYNYGPLFTPPSFQKPTIELPGIAGGASWSGAACDPETGICYVSSVTLPYVATLTKISVPNTDYYGKMTPVETMQCVPLWKPPYGLITAIDLNTGDHRWMTPAGDLAQSNPVLRQLGLRGLGRAARGHLLLTKTLLIVGQEGGTHREGGSPEEVPDFEIRDPKLSAYDKETGKVVGEVALPRNATGAPMTYMLNGMQFIVVPIGCSNLPAKLIALHLPLHRAACITWPIDIKTARCLLDGNST